MPGDAYGPTNWGRWGDDDERGTLNFLTPEVVLRAKESVRVGAVVSLGALVGPNGPVFSGRSQSVHTVRYFDRRPTGYADDLLVLNSHSSTHIDGLAHFFLDGAMYNNVPVVEAVSSEGIAKNSIDRVGAIVARGVLLDIAKFRGVDCLEAGAVVHSAELDACALAHGVELRTGDVCLVRTGWIKQYVQGSGNSDGGEPGLSVDVADWFHQHELVAIGVDNGAVEVLPPEPGQRAFGLHPRIIQRQGGYLLEFLDLEELSAAGVAEFLFVTAPLKIQGGAGSPVNPVAIY